MQVVLGPFPLWLSVRRPHARMDRLASAASVVLVVLMLTMLMLVRTGVMIVNMLADLAHGLLDPRVLESKS